MVNKIIAKYRENGFLGLLIALMARMPGVRALCVYYVYRLPFSKLPQEDSALEKLRICVLENDAAINDIVRIQDKPDIFRERFILNHFCLLAYVGDEPVAYLWGQQGPMHLEQCYGFEVPIADNQVYYYDSHTRQEWRQKGLLRCLIQNIAQYGAGMLQKNELIAIIEINNKVSQKSHEKIGFVKDRLQLFVNIMGKSFQLRLRTF